MGFSLGGLAAAVCAAAISSIGGGDAGAPASTLGDGGGKAVTAFTTFSSPPAEHGIEVSAPKSSPSGGPSI